MERRIEGRVTELAGVLSVVSIALVFGAVLGYLPGYVLPEAPAWVFDAIPHVNVVLSLAAIASISLGWYWIRRGEVARHRAAMLTAVCLFATFLVCYLYRLSVVGTTPFGGPEVVHRFVYLPLLAVHVTLAIVCIPLLYYVLLLALSRPVSAIYETNHARIGRVAAALWLVSFSFGVTVYVLLRVAW